MIDKETQKLIRKYNIRTTKRVEGSLLKYEVDGVALKDLEFPPDNEKGGLDIYGARPSAKEIVRLINRFLTDNNLSDAHMQFSSEEGYDECLCVYSDIPLSEEQIISDLKSAIDTEDQTRKSKLAEKEAKRKKKEEEELRQLEELKAKYERLSTS